MRVTPTGSNGSVTGFPSRADLWRERPLSLDDLVLLHPSTTYFLRVRNQIPQNLGICRGDRAVIDQSLDLVSGTIILATLCGTFILRRVRIQGATLRLESGHPRYPAFAVTPAMQFALWEVALFVLRDLPCLFAPCMHLALPQRAKPRPLLPLLWLIVMPSIVSCSLEIKTITMLPARGDRLFDLKERFVGQRVITAPPFPLACP